MLSNICFQQIRNNYYHGQYGNFSVVIDRDNGYINATKLCSDGGKQFKHWSDTKMCKELVNTLKQHVFSESIEDEYARDSWAMAQYNPVGEVVKQVLTAKQTEEDKMIAGTYIHPLLIPHVACWVSPAFALKASSLINNYICEEYKYKLQVAQQLQEDLRMEMDSLEYQNMVLQDSVNNWREITDDKTAQVEIKKEVVQDLEEKVCKQIKQKQTWSKTHAFTLLRTNDEDSISYPYYGIRCRRKAVGTAIKKFRCKHPKAEVIYQQNKVPNAINLFCRLKEEHAINTKRNYFSHLLAGEGQLFELVSSLCGSAKPPCNVEPLNCFREM